MLTIADVKSVCSLSCALVITGERRSLGDGETDSRYSFSLLLAWTLQVLHFRVFYLAFTVPCMRASRNGIYFHMGSAGRYVYSF